MAACMKQKKAWNPENTTRAFELVYALLSVCLSMSWNSKGITYSQLNDGDYNEGGTILFFMTVAILTLIYVGGATLYSFSQYPKILHPVVDMATSGVFALMTFLSSILMFGALSTLYKSASVREAGLTFGSLMTALGFNLGLSFMLATSVLFSWCLYRNVGELVIVDSMNLRYSRSADDLTIGVQA